MINYLAAVFAFALSNPCKPNNLVVIAAPVFSDAITPLRAIPLVNTVLAETPSLTEKTKHSKTDD